MSETTAVDGVEARMLRVMAEAGVIGKDRKAPGLNYAFRGIDDVLPVLQPLFVKHGVLPVPEVIDRERETVQTSNGKPMFSVRLLVRFTFRSPGFAPVVATTLGEAMDSGDKASNKAMTAAFKAALTMSFSIPTHESDRDTEEASPELAAPKAAAPRPAAKGPANKPTAVAQPIGPSGRVPTFAAPDELAKEVGVLKGLIQTAPNREALDLLTPRLKSLPEADRDALRPLFNTRLGEVTKGAA